MAKSGKDAISAKISKLVKEGIPQKRAVAAAHQMARDGKLGLAAAMAAGKKK